MSKKPGGVFVIAVSFTVALSAQDRATCGATRAPAANWEQIVHADCGIDTEWSARGQNAPSSPAVISAATLAHKPSRDVRREFERGVRAWRKGAANLAVEHLSEAVRLDSDFIDALSELGFVYVKTGHPELALAHVERAAKLAPNLAILQTNYAATLLALNRAPEAEAAARRAVQLDPRGRVANHLLGVALAMQAKNTAKPDARALPEAVAPASTIEHEPLQN